MAYEVYTSDGLDMQVDSYNKARLRFDDIAIDDEKPVILFDNNSTKVLHARGEGMALLHLLEAVLKNTGPMC